MSRVNFDPWAVQPLELTLGGHTYQVPPPDTETLRRLGAIARGAIAGAIGRGTDLTPDELEIATAPIAPQVLGDLADRMLADGAAPFSVDRVATYVAFYWVHGAPAAERLAAAFWAEPAEAADGAAPVTQLEGAEAP